MGHSAWAGRVHLEWGASADAFWLFQLDFENDLPDDGFRPEDLLRDVDLRSASNPPLGSALTPVDLAQKTGWRKIDKVADFIPGRASPYPKLFWITGDRFIAAQLAYSDFLRDLSSIAYERLICRTDCSSPNVSPLNLPRTESVSAEAATVFMSETLTELGSKGVAPEQVCFIIHRFIPATSAAWALARPDSQLVRVDALWGLPDGLQYLPHDTFEFDVKRGQGSSERIRYKPAFLQETEDGTWRVIKVERRSTRRRSLAGPDLAEVSLQTHDLALRLKRPIQVMWFCGIPEEIEVGRNVPWFRMEPEEGHGRSRSISPTRIRLPIRQFDDLALARQAGFGGVVLQVDPEDPTLFRSTEFLEALVRVAKDRSLPVIMVGSVLGHAFYTLDREGVDVIAADEPTRSRTRRRQVFNKLVRDDIPAQISGHGERIALATIAKGEARPALAAKLLEELFELLAAGSPDEVTLELADVLEVVRSMASATGVDWDEVERSAETKRARRGSFERGVVLVETSWPKRGEQPDALAPENIKLAQLSRTVSRGVVHEVPFSSLLAEGGDRSVALTNGAMLTLSMSGSGVRIEEGESKTVSPWQLPLRFDQP